MKTPLKIIPINNTIKISPQLRDRIHVAMARSGFSVWSEFCRVALTEKCQREERQAEEEKGNPTPGKVNLGRLP